MSDHQHVRVHLRQAILVGHSPGARYAKVLTGIRQPLLDQRLTNGEQLIAVDVFGIVTAGRNTFEGTPFPPHTHLLASYNVLSIEDMALAPNMHFEGCPPSAPGRLPTQPCTNPYPHLAHLHTPPSKPRPQAQCRGRAGN